MLRTVLLKLATGGKSTESSCSHESFSFQQNSAPSQSPADSALPGVEHLVWPLAPTKAAESKAQLPVSDCTDMPRLESSGMH